jgi:hypothetical protein
MLRYIFGALLALVDHELVATYKGRPSNTVRVLNELVGRLL